MFLKAKEEMDKLLRAMEEKLLNETKQLEKEKSDAVLQVKSEKEAVEHNLQHSQAEVITLSLCSMLIIKHQQRTLANSFSAISNYKNITFEILGSLAVVFKLLSL